LAGEADLNLACTGHSYKQDGPFPSVETFSVKIEGTKPVTIGLIGSEKPVKARVVANNAIQLRLATGKFTGEYFHFTGDANNAQSALQMGVCGFAEKRLINRMNVPLFSRVRSSSE
jgi:hypothetical protein